MSRISRKSRVPDALADLYDFANTLDQRCFQHRGVRMQPSDGIDGPAKLAAWLTDHGRGGVTGKTGGTIGPAALQRARELREAIRAFLENEPARRKADHALHVAFNDAARWFPLVAQVGPDGSTTLGPAHADALNGLSVVVAQFYDAARSGLLDRLKMCDSTECRWVFYDRSKPGTRRWCEQATCGNRMKTRAYRERHRTPT